MESAFNIVINVRYYNHYATTLGLKLLFTFNVRKRVSTSRKRH